ncbi:hypothetical protein JHK85_051441 [Glycine max]|nr:hypothetical protein JHK85_051441 [Glycine max]
MKSAAKGYKNCRTSWLLQKRTPETGEKVIYLENDNVLLENKQKELKGTLNNLLQSRQNFVNAYEVVLDLDETLVCAFETSSLPAALWTQAIEGGLNCLQLVLKAMLDPLLTE